MQNKGNVNRYGEVWTTQNRLPLQSKNSHNLITGQLSEIRYKVVRNGDYIVRRVRVL